MSVTVRRARIEDALVVADYAQKLVAQHVSYDPRRFVQIADHQQFINFYGGRTQVNDAAVLVGEIEGKVIGFAYIQFEERNYAALLQSAAWIHDIYIDEAVRGRHVGEKLIEGAIQVGKELGATKLMLSVAAQNEYAKDFFEHQGFKTTMVEMMLDLTEK